jgi:hypothetical protein
MIPVLVVQMTLDKVVGMIAVRHRLMAARWAVFLSRLVTGASIVRRALGGIRLTRLDHVLVDVVAMRMMQVAVMQVVDVIAMAYGGVSAVRTVPMRVIGLCRLRAVRHGRSPLATVRRGAETGLGVIRRAAVLSPGTILRQPSAALTRVNSGAFGFAEGGCQRWQTIAQHCHGDFAKL